MKRVCCIIFQFTALAHCKVLNAQCVPSEPCVQMKVVAINSKTIAATSEVTIQPGDTVVVDFFGSAWTPTLPDMKLYQVEIRGAAGAESGDTGLVLPRGWDAPTVRDSCPCDATFPICDSQYGCVGINHEPVLGSELNTDRSDFVFTGHPTISSAAVSTLDFIWGASINGDYGIQDGGAVWYLCRLFLVATSDARGTFEFEFEPGVGHTFFTDSEPTYLNSIAPHVEGLTIHVECGDELYCNGVEIDHPDNGCLPGLPPCDDGVACTIDQCDEAVDGCANVPNHAACDDGDECTRDECTPAGCVHFDDLCGDIPATSQWGLAVLILGLLIVAKLRFRPRLA